VSQAIVTSIFMLKLTPINSSRYSGQFPLFS